MRKKTRAQSFVEYLLVFGALILAAIIGSKMLAVKTQSQMNTSGKVMDRAVKIIEDKI